MQEAHFKSQGKKEYHNVSYLHWEVYFKWPGHWGRMVDVPPYPIPDVRTLQILIRVRFRWWPLHHPWCLVQHAVGLLTQTMITDIPFKLSNSREPIWAQIYSRIRSLYSCGRDFLPARAYVLSTSLLVRACVLSPSLPGFSHSLCSEPKFPYTDLLNLARHVQVAHWKIPDQTTFKASDILQLVGIT